MTLPKLPIMFDRKFEKLKSKKDLVLGMALRVPWPKDGLNTDLDYKICTVIDIMKSGYPVVETPNGGRLEITNLKEMYYLAESVQKETTA